MDILLHAFDTPTGIPWNQLNLKTHVGKNPGWTAKMSTLAGPPLGNAPVPSSLPAQPRLPHSARRRILR